MRHEHRQPRPRSARPVQAAGGVLLLVAVAAALAWSNSPWRASYEGLWTTAMPVTFGGWSLPEDLRDWVSDGLMAVFFFVVALELRRELATGELRGRRALLPAAAAVGGMAVPAVLYLAFDPSPGSRGWGIPMATDIAFGLGLLWLLGSRVPPAVKTFFLALAIADDLGSIVVIATVYARGVEVAPLAVAAAALVLVLVLARRGVRAAPVFVALGLAAWAAVHASGVNATVAGVAMGFLVPGVPLRWESGMHRWTSLLVVPVFVLANAGVDLRSVDLGQPRTRAVVGGLVLARVAGKLGGIVLGTWVALRLARVVLPEGVTWRHVAGTAVVAAVGFTVPLFVATLAYPDPGLVDATRVGLLAASVVAAVAGAVTFMSGAGIERPPPGD